MRGETIQDKQTNTDTYPNVHPHTHAPTRRHTHSYTQNTHTPNKQYKKTTSQKRKELAHTPSEGCTISSYQKCHLGVNLRTYADAVQCA